MQKIIREIHAVTFFSVIADETSDRSHVEQLCLCLRYVSEDCVVKEQFISFGGIENCTAQGISNEILARLVIWGCQSKIARNKVTMVRLLWPVTKEEFKLSSIKKLLLLFTCIAPAMRLTSC